MNRKVCFYIGSMSLGGIGKMSLHLMTEFIKRGIQVDLVLMKGGGEYIDQLPDEVNVFVQNGSYIKRIVKFLIYLFKERPAISLSARQRQDFANIFCCLLTFGKTRPIITIHTALGVENRLSKHFRNSGFHVTLLSKLLYKIPQKFIAVSNGVADDFSQRTGVKRSLIKTIYNPVPKYVSEEEKIVIPGVFSEKLSKGKRFLIAVGRFTEAKDFGTLLRSFALVRKEEDISLVILGDGPLRGQIEKEIAELDLIEDVLLLGYVPNPQFYISQASAFVMSSKWEGFGIVIVEALGVGIPVIATDCPSGPSEILEGGKYGKLVAVGDFDGMAAAIIDTLRSSHDAVYLKKRAMRFSSEKVAEEYLNYIFDH